MPKQTTPATTTTSTTARNTQLPSPPAVVQPTNNREPDGPNGRAAPHPFPSSASRPVVCEPVCAGGKEAASVGRATAAPRRRSADGASTTDTDAAEREKERRQLICICLMRAAAGRRRFSRRAFACLAAAASRAAFSRARRFPFKKCFAPSSPSNHRLTLALTRQ